MQVQQHVDSDLSKNQRVGPIALRLRWVVGEHTCLDIARNISGSKFLPESQQRHGEGNVEPHAEGGGSKNHPPDRRRIIVNPGRGDHGAEAVGEDDRVLQVDPIRRDKVSRPLVGVVNHGRKVRRCPTFSGRTAVAALVPGEHGNVLQAKRRHRLLPTTGVFVSPVKQE